MAVIVAMGFLSGCGLPAAAPTSQELVGTAADPDFHYSLVNIDGHVASVINQVRSSFDDSFKRAGYVATNALRAGDVVSITVYESGGSTLFPPPTSFPGASLTGQPGVVSPGVNTVPPQTIETDGTVKVPFVGAVKVTGMTPAQAGRAIEKQLQGKAVNPQVIVTLVNNNANAVAVSGDVNAAKVISLTLRGERLLDVIADAGGPKFPPYDTYVQVVRGKHVGSVLLQTVINDPAENIHVRPNDQIVLTRYPRSFAVLGATMKVSQYLFDAEKVTLAEAVARAGGPIDTVGDPAGIYLFRFETWPIAKQVLSTDDLQAVGLASPEFVPILYHLNLRSAEGYFLAQAVNMRDKDVVLITNSEVTQLQKLMTVIRGFTGVAYDLKRQTY